MKWFKRDRMKNKIFAIREGEYKGNFFVYVGTSDDKYKFLTLPDNDAVEVPIEEFNNGLNKKIVDYIEKLPNNVYEICCAQYNESKARQNINRLKQSPTPSGVDRGKH